MRIDSKWSIGIFTGESPLNFRSPPSIENPVLTHRDVTDAPAAFVADPFMIHASGSWYMFFEVMNRRTEKGEIGFATSPDGLHWSYQQIVLAEPFHLSYPYVFRWLDDYFMIPETLAAHAIRLYRADPFPHRWSPAGSLLDVVGADPSPFYFAGKWWMFICTTPYEHDTLCLYCAEQLTGPWVEHPKNPIVSGNKRTARPGGRVLVLEDKVIRYAQDCYPLYGTQLRAFEVARLTETDYIERESAHSPVLRAANSEWNARQMHHIDPHPTTEGRWIACVDGHPLEEI